MATSTKKSKAPTKATRTAPSTPPAKAATGSDAQGVISRVFGLHQLLAAFDHAAARALDINRTDLACLRFLAAGPQKARSIGAALGLTSGSVTALLDRLEAHKLIRRAQSAQDRRAIDVELTAPSARRLTKVYEALDKALSGAAGGHKKANLDAAGSVLADLEAACTAAIVDAG